MTINQRLAATKTYWQISSDLLGLGPLHKTQQEAVEERLMLLEDDDTDRITIHSETMRESEYAALPEHQGY